GATLDRYLLGRVLGSGTFGTVYVAEDLQLQRQVAIKIPGSPQHATAQQMNCLIEEARAAAALQHPAIVTIYDVQPLPAGRLYAVMQFVDGQTLRSLLDAG